MFHRAKVGDNKHHGETGFPVADGPDHDCPLGAHLSYAIPPFVKNGLTKSKAVTIIIACR